MTGNPTSVRVVLKGNRQFPGHTKEGRGHRQKGDYGSLMSQEVGKEYHPLLTNQDTFIYLSIAIVESTSHTTPRVGTGRKPYE